MHTSHPTSLLVAALVMLRHPCTKNKATARLLLERAAECVELTPSEREACRTLADDLDIDRPEPVVIRMPAPARRNERRRHMRLLPGLPVAPDPRGGSA